MKTSVLKKLALAAFVAGATAFAPLAAAIDVRGDFEYDISLKDSDAAIGDDPEGSSSQTSGRVRIIVSHTETRGDNFVTGYVQANQGFNQSATTDDAWIQFGSSRWDLKIGRFEAFNLFPGGKDTFVSMMGVVGDVAGDTVTTSVTGYQANALRGRQQNGLAFNFNLSSALSFELGTVWGDRNPGDAAVGDTATMFNGWRPVLTWSQGPFSVSAGLEIIDNEPEMTDANGNLVTPKETAIDQLDGLGLTASAELAGGSLNFNYATADITTAGFAAASMHSEEERTRTSIGVNYTLGPWGVGMRMDEDELNKTGDATCMDVPATMTTAAVPCANDDTVFYAAYTVPILRTGANATFAYSQSDAQSGLRVRFNYAF